MTIRLLIIEDSEDDMLLLLRELQRGGYKPVFERVDAPEAMRAALAREDWDLVISDYVMPSFSGLAALDILKESGLDLPFIIVSGNIGEDIAVRAMKAGAHDYIIKGNLKRLVPAVQRELREAEARRERREAGRSAELSSAILRLFAEKFTQAEYLDAVTELIVEWSGCRYAGIRVLDDIGNIPYSSSTGFGPDFLETESLLSIRTDHCICTRVIGARPEPHDMPAMTPHGSFYSNDTVSFVESLTDEEKLRFRGFCIRRGYSSLAVIPIRHREQVIGAIHLADERKNIMPLRKVEFLEQMGFFIGEATYRFRMEEDLRRNHDALMKSNELLEQMFSNIHVLVAYMDKHFNFIRVNRAYAQAEGKEPEFFPGKNHFSLYPNSDNEKIFRKVVETGKPFSVTDESFVYEKDPERGVSYWDWSLLPVKAPDGMVEGLVLSLLNVTDRKLTEAKIELERNRLKSILDTIPDGICIVDRLHRLSYCNPAIEKEFGTAGRAKCCEYLPEGPKACSWCRNNEISESNADRWEWHVQEAQKTYEVLATHILDDNGEVSKLQIVYDITPRKQREKKERVLAKLLSLFAKNTSMKEYLQAVTLLLHEWSGCGNIGIRMVDEKRFIPYRNHIGFSEDFMALENMLSLDTDICACIRIITGVPEPPDASVMTPGGSICINDSTAFLEGLTEEQQGRYRGNCIRRGFRTIAVVPVRYRDTIFGAIHLTDTRPDMLSVDSILFIETMSNLIGEAIHRLKTEEALRASEENLRHSQEQLRQFHAHVQEAAEQERGMIAREIHDELGTVFTALKIDLSWLERKLSADHADLTERMKKDVDLVNSAIKTVQKISSELRPGILDHLGLSAAVHWQVSEVARRTGLESNLSIEMDENIDRDLSTAIFRIVQEALTNIVRHAHATTVTVNLREADGHLLLRIADNGRGIDDREMAAADSYGLIGMRERVQHFGGRIEIRGIKDKGTTIEVSVPLKKVEGK